MEIELEELGDQITVEVEDTTRLKLAQEQLADVRKQLKRVRYLLDTTHGTDMLTKLWNNYCGLIELELKLTTEFKIY